MKSILFSNGRVNVREMSRQIGITEQTIANRLRKNYPVLSTKSLPADDVALVDSKIGHFLRHSPDAHLFDCDGYFRGVSTAVNTVAPVVPQVDVAADLKAQMINTLQDQLLDIITDINSVDTLLELLQVAKNVNTVKEVA